MIETQDNALTSWLSSGKDFTGFTICPKKGCQAIWLWEKGDDSLTKAHGMMTQHFHVSHPDIDLSCLFRQLDFSHRYAFPQEGFLT